MGFSLNLPLHSSVLQQFYTLTRPVGYSIIQYCVRRASHRYVHNSSVLCGDPALRFCSGNLGIKVYSVLVAMCVKNEYID